jgi:hypothetical protein
VGVEERCDVGDVVGEQLIDAGQVGDGLAGLVDDEAGAAFVGEVVDALGGDDLHELDVRVELGQHRQLLVEQVAELVVVLVEVQHHEGLGVGLSHLPDVLVAGYLLHLPVLLLHRLHLELLHAVGHVLAREIIVEVEVVVELVDLLHRHLVQSVLELALLLVLLLHHLLLLRQRGLLLVGQVVAVLHLQVEPLSRNPVCH